MIGLDQLLGFGLAALVLIVVPGPSVVFVVGSSSVRRTWSGSACRRSGTAGKGRSTQPPTARP